MNPHNLASTQPLTDLCQCPLVESSEELKDKGGSQDTKQVSTGQECVWRGEQKIASTENFFPLRSGQMEKSTVIDQIHKRER